MRKILNIVFVLSLIAVPVWADVLVPTFFAQLAKKEEEAEKTEKVFELNDELYSCDTPRILFFETEKLAKEACGLCPNREIRKEAIKKYLPEDEYRFYKEEILYNNRDNLKVYACISKTIKECPADKPLLDSYGFCYSCDEKGWVDTSWNTKACAACPNREIRKVDDHNCILKCPSDKPLRDVWGDCYSCDDPDGIENESENSICPNRVAMSYKYSKYSILKECPLGMSLRDNRGGCHFCDEEDSIETSEESCAVCLNREVKGHNCILKCPSDKPFRDGWGNCYSCDDPKEVSFGSTDKTSNDVVDDSNCPNRVITHQTDTFTVIVDNRVSTQTQTAEYSVLKECPSDMPLRDARGRCYSCDYETNVQLSENAEDSSKNQKACAVCPNREVKGYNCVLKCSSDMPLHDASGKCRSCDDPKEVFLGFVKDKTSNDVVEDLICPNRVMKSTYNGHGSYAYSILKECPSNMPLRDGTGGCYSCDEEYSIETSEETCAVCPNREVKGYNCVLKCSPDEPLQGQNGKCHSCDDSDSVLLETTKISEKISTKRGRWRHESNNPVVTVEDSICPNRVIFNENFGDINHKNSILKECPSNEPLRSSWKKCYSCDEEKAIQTSREACDVCPNRKFSKRKNVCRLKQ